ncbi:hypothetical protein CC2G_000251 [Coprinopsis cinerea AmutBmut pab1-1]|nr:hypothetical protein CC2G_000251 [Coprinopsis cinerea AmutBmut pab1-1]
MWPLHSIGNASALWLMWMFATRDRLLNETPQQREEIIKLVLPFMVCPLRYASALVPPNHFTLPIGDSNPAQNRILTLDTPHGPYPLYHTERGSYLVLYYFRSSASFVEPLVAPVASLLFWSRRELDGALAIPTALPRTSGLRAVKRHTTEACWDKMPQNQQKKNPQHRESNPRPHQTSRLGTRASIGGSPGLTQEDLIEYNAHKSARLPNTVIWDWERGCPIRRAEDGTTSDWPDQDSERWDIDWWRARLCDGVFLKQPKFRLGPVYIRGILTGLWQGVQFNQSPMSFTTIASQRQRPLDLSEQSLLYSGRPLMFRLKEHGFIRTPASTTDAGRTERTCVPQAPPLHTPVETSMAGRIQRTTFPFDASLSNAWFPGPVGSLRWVDNGPPLDDGVLRDRFKARESLANGEKAKDPMPSVQLLVSNNSPFDPRNSSFISEGGGPIDAATLNGQPGKVFVYETYEKGKESVHARMLDARERYELSSSSAATSLSTASDTAAPSLGPQRHPGCLRCAERNAFLKNRKAKDAFGRRCLTKEQLDEAFSAVGMGRVSTPSADDMDSGDDTDVFDLDIEGDDDDETDEESGDEGDPTSAHHDTPISDLVPVSSSSLPPSGESTPAASTSSHSTSDAEFAPRDAGDDGDFDFDAEKGQPGVRDSKGRVHLEPIRRSHDRYRVEKCCDGIEDVVVTGEMDQRHRLAWGHNVYYGRVRPWDGMVAILRIGRDILGMPNTFLIYYGYIYGGDTFVGNWRYAARDPLSPNYECSFIMSKRDG